MAEAGLLAVPLPFVTAALALAIALRMTMGGFGTAASRWLFVGLFVVLALQALLVGLRFGYGIADLIGLQRVLPLLTAPLTYLGFRALAEPLPGRRGIALHLGAALGLMALMLFWPGPVDLVIALSFLVYILLSTRLLARGPGAFEVLPLAAVASVRRWLLAAILFLAFVAVMDLAIALDFATAAGRGAPALIGLGSLVVIPALVAAAMLWPRVGVEVPARPGEAASQLVDRLDRLLDETGLHRDPDLSLGRMARRLGLPAREVSDAVNRARGCNVSQFVNDHRVRDAAARLAASDVPVAELMLEVGFRSRSNFYREFARVFSMTPAEHRRRAAAQPASQAASSGVVASTTSASPRAGGSRRST